MSVLKVLCRPRRDERNKNMGVLKVLCRPRRDERKIT